MNGLNTSLQEQYKNISTTKKGQQMLAFPVSLLLFIYV